jgi:ferric-dicitrate binding protein FerR (iron transport regulator)
MTHDRIDRLVQAADPYVARDLHGAEQNLLEEILAASPAERDELASRRRHRRRSLIVGVAAAAVLAVTVGAAALVQDKPSPRRARRATAPTRFATRRPRSRWPKAIPDC